ncbi:MAG: serine protease [Candidatus Paceibacterota bacterium]|jgi:hypothetical protein
MSNYLFPIISAILSTIIGISGAFSTPAKNIQVASPKNATISDNLKISDSPSTAIANSSKPKADASPKTKTYVDIKATTTAKILPEKIPEQNFGGSAVSTSTSPLLSWDEINVKTRSTLVNIICTTQSGGSFEPISGSGVIIDKRGVILTSAHIAEYFLLKDYKVKNFINCVVRQGSPAQSMFKAELLFISPKWIETNYKKMKTRDPSGTGENDYAFLKIKEKIDGSPLSQDLPYLETDFQNTDIDKNQAVLIAGYAAEFLGGISIQRDLYAVSSIATVSKLLSFASTTFDVIGLNGNIAAQKGSSGGAIVSNQNKLVGIISTVVEARQTDNRKLMAITLEHINRSFFESNGFEVSTMLSTNLDKLTEQFNSEIAPVLTKVLTDELDKK